MKKAPILAVFILLAGVYVYSTQKPQQAVKLLRKPYLQSAIADSVTILWRTETGKDAKVAFRETGETEWEIATGLTRITNTGVTENEVTLKQLDPDTRYEYQIYTDQQHLLPAQPLYFVSPIGKWDSVFSFFAVGDIGEPVKTEGTPDLLGEAIAHYVDSLRLGLLLGDIIYPNGKSKDYDENLFQYFGDVFPYVPIFPVFGNHDWHEPEDNYIEEWKLPNNEHYYSFEHGNVHFIGLDTQNGELYEYDQQVAWLEEDLSKIPPHIDWRVAFLHHNGKSCTYKKDYEAVVSLYPLFEEYGVDLVLNGHAHTYERLNPMNGQADIVMNEASSPQSYVHPEGFIAITIGSGGKLRGFGSDPKFWRPNPDTCRYQGLVAAYMHDWAFLTLDVNGKHLKGKAITTKNLEVVDWFEIDKR